MSILNMLHSGERLERPANSACLDELLVYTVISNQVLLCAQSSVHERCTFSAFLMDMDKGDYNVITGEPLVSFSGMIS